MNASGQLLKDVEQYVTNLFAENMNEKLVYHNMVHTLGVVKAVEQIAAHYRLEGDELMTVRVAAWFHDAGYLFVEPKLHEEKGAELAAAFLLPRNVPADIIKKISGCILATKIPQKPANLLEEITCDADLFHLGTDQFKDLNKLMRKEKELLTGKKMTGPEWRTENIAFMEAHHYFTDYAKALQNQLKKENLKSLKDKQEEKEQENLPAHKNEKMPAGSAAAAATDAASQDQKHKKKDIPERGIETMFRLTSANHIELSGMADSKANILISVNSIIVSVLLSVLLRKLDTYPHLVIPTVLFLLTCVITMIFAILSTRPSVPDGMTKREDIKKEMGNLLFFGNFHKMKLEDYEWGMNEMMKDKDFLYGSLIRDIYYLGVVLGRKYRQLRIAYSVFMFGFVISVLAFVIAML